MNLTGHFSVESLHFCLATTWLFLVSLVVIIIAKVFFCIYFTAIVSTMKQVAPKVWDNVLSEPQSIRNIAFAMCVIQSMLAARQLFGTQGLNQYYPFTQVQTSQAINLTLSRMLRQVDEEGGEPVKEKLIDMVSKVGFVEISSSLAFFLHVKFDPAEPGYALPLQTV